MRIDQSMEIARKIGRRGGIFVLLVHPNILGHKLDFVKALIDRNRESAWFGSLEQYGHWWAARDKVVLDAEPSGNRLVLKLDAPERIAGLTLAVPPHWKLAATTTGAHQIATGILLDEFTGRKELILEPARQAKLD